MAKDSGGGGEIIIGGRSVIKKKVKKVKKVKKGKKR